MELRGAGYKMDRVERECGLRGAFLCRGFFLY